MTSRTKTALLASALLAMPAAALAQNEVSERAEAVSELAEQLQREANALGNAVANDSTVAADDRDGARDGDRDGDDDDGHGKWGLLGLLGLAGLLGLKRRDDAIVDRRSHVDRRQTPPPGTRADVVDDTTGSRL